MLQLPTVNYLRIRMEQSLEKYVYRLHKTGILLNITDFFGLLKAYPFSDDKPERHSGFLPYDTLSSQVRKDHLIAFAYVAKLPCFFHFSNQNNHTGHNVPGCGKRHNVFRYPINDDD